METEIKDALNELGDNIRELGKIRKKMKKMMEEEVKMQEEIEKMQEEFGKIPEDIGKMQEEIEKMQEKVVKMHGAVMQEIELKTVIKHHTKLIALKKTKIALKKKLIALKKKLIALKKYEMRNVLLAVNKLKSLQFNFIDDQIISRLASNAEEKHFQETNILRLLELGSRASNTLDDVRLLLLENIKRGSGKEMLSVVKLCSNPTVKVISTKKNIQKNFIDSAKVFNLDKEKSEEILVDSKVLMSRGVLLESDILEVLIFPRSCPDPVTAVVKITTEPSNLPLFDFQVVFKSGKDWEIITAHTQEGYVEFPLRSMKYLFVISREKWVAHTLSPGGLNYKSADVEHVTVRFPPRSVRKNCEIQIQVVPPNPVEQTEYTDPNAHPDSDVDTDIVSVSPRLWVTHDDVLKFEKPIVVTLPLPPASSTENETDLCLIKWTDGDDVNIVDTSIHLKEGFCEFEVDGFTGYSVLRRRGRRKTKLCKPDINEYYMPNRGLSKECQILILSDKSAVNTLWIEIVESNRVQDLLKVRLQQQQLVQITNISYPTMSVRYGQIMKIYALGGIRIHSNYQADYLQIKFTEKVENNHLRFQVELIDENSSAMLKLRLRNKKIYFCHFEANEWLRQRTETSQTTPEAESQRKTLLTANKTLHLTSIQALARQIPIRQTEELATELNLFDNEVADLKAHNYKGIQLTFQVLCKWRQKSDQEASDMIQELATALNTLSLKNIASKLLTASKERRSLVNEDFVE